jgi:hypothetical protein
MPTAAAQHTAHSASSRQGSALRDVQVAKDAHGGSSGQQDSGSSLVFQMEGLGLLPGQPHLEYACSLLLCCSGTRSLQLAGGTCQLHACCWQSAVPCCCQSPLPSPAAGLTNSYGRDYAHWPQQAAHNARPAGAANSGQYRAHTVTAQATDSPCQHKTHDLCNAHPRCHSHGYGTCS